MSRPLKRFVDSLRGLFSDPDNNDPLKRMTDIEPEGAEDSYGSEEDLQLQVAGTEMEQEAET